MTVVRNEVRLLKALAHPVRLRILEILCQREECVCHLNAILGKTQPYVSQQLAVLRRAGLVEDVRIGQHTYYRVRDGRLAELRALVRDMVGLPAEGSAASEPSPYPLEGCSCPRCREARQGGHV
ncbi:MAG: ArsR/SmtB family transcription factor [Anaerolineae bacterium]